MDSVQERAAAKGSWAQQKDMRGFAGSAEECSFLY